MTGKWIDANGEYRSPVLPSRYLHPPAHETQIRAYHCEADLIWSFHEKNHAAVVFCPFGIWL